MLARTPLRSAGVQADPHRRLTRARKQGIRDRIVAIMRSVEPTPFAGEGPCRAGIRSSLCLQGWRWPDADAIAAEIVMAALNVVGAKRPSWWEGQPEYTQPGALPIEREYCGRFGCHNRVPPERRKFCSDYCGSAHRDAMSAAQHYRAERVADAAVRAAWRSR